MDRIDLHVEVPALASEDLLQAAAGEATHSIRARCKLAYARAQDRQGKNNQALAGQEIDQHVYLESAAAKFLQSAARQLGWSARGTHRTLKIARTIADLAGSDITALGHVAEAMQYRRALKSV
jgi:magnesium chelatase family protein